jgi:hypothetical protein
MALIFLFIIIFINNIEGEEDHHHHLSFSLYYISSYVHKYIINLYGEMYYYYYYYYGTYVSYHPYHYWPTYDDDDDFIEIMPKVRGELFSSFS